MLPPQLTTLKLGNRYRYSSYSPSFWTHLPPQLTKISAYTEAYVSTDSEMPIAPLIPRSLTRIEGNFWDHSLQLNELPSHLEKMSTAWIKPSDLLKSPPLAHIFTNLGEIWIETLTPQLLGLLPPTIHTIDASRITASFTKDQWPTSLRTLKFRDSKDNFPTSPLSLTTLEIANDSHFEPSHISRLPRTLLHLDLTFYQFSENDDFPVCAFPPHLTFLSVFLSGETGYDYPYCDLPASITTLNLSVNLPASQIKNLPPRLKTINVDSVVEDFDFDSTSKLEMAAMRLNFENGRREGVLESFDFTLLKRASIFALLPRTLTYLSIWGDKCKIDDCRMLPLRLETFSCWISDGLPISILHQLKHMKNLHTIDINVRGVEDHRLKLIPREIRRIQLRIVHSPKITPMALQYVPAWIQVKISAIRSKILDFTQSLLTHAQDEDPTHFLKLLAPDRDLLLNALSD